MLQPVKQLAGQVQTLRQGLRLERQRADGFREQAERHDEALREIQQVLAQKSRELSELSRQDLLTGLPNQRVFDEGLRREFKRAQRQRGCLALAVLDLDQFKNFNERYGQEAGNATLQQFSSLLSEHFKRDTDLVARLGGEEFVVMLPGLALDNSQQLLEQLREEFRALAIRHEGGVGVGLDGTTHVLTVSIGLAVYSPAHPYLSPQALLQAADEALYIAKHTGRDRLSRAAAKARSTERS
nr:GGDEF domain-containing protein [Roseateles koreensis]